MAHRPHHTPEQCQSSSGRGRTSALYVRLGTISRRADPLGGNGLLQLSTDDLRLQSREHRTHGQRHHRRRRLARNMVAHVRRETLRLGRGYELAASGPSQTDGMERSADARRRPHHGRNGRYARTAGELPQLQEHPHRRGDAHPFGFLGDSSAVVRKRHRPRREGGQRRPQRRRMRPRIVQERSDRTLLFRYGRRLYRHQVGAQFRRSPLEHSERESCATAA